MEEKQFTLRFGNRAIEHLGVKLYQNHPSEVIVEYIANSWDADASQVAISLFPVVQGTDFPVLVIADNGNGMNPTEIQEDFLVIGNSRRKVSGITKLKRQIMGRKGIGKLAGFGIATVLHLITKSHSVESKNHGIYWLKFDLKQLLANEEKNKSDTSYYPEIIANDVSFEEFKKLVNEKGLSTALEKAEGFFREGSGTTIMLGNTSLKKNPNKEDLKRKIVDKLAYALFTDQFEVSINQEKLNPEELMPLSKNFQIGNYRNPNKEYITIKGEEKPIKFYATLIEPQHISAFSDNIGVAVYAHNRMVQVRPFFFGLERKGAITNHLFATVQADWLDDQIEDLTSTDRTSIDWDSEYAIPLQEWGEKKTKEWINSFEDLAKKDKENKIRNDLYTSSISDLLSTAEIDQLIPLLVQIFPSFGEDQSNNKKTYKVMADAWTNKPMKIHVQRLWKHLAEKGRLSPTEFPDLVEELIENSIPEVLNLSVVVAQRISAISQMQTFIEKGNQETDLQRLIEKFPWLLGHHWEKLTANQSIRTLGNKLVESNVLKNSTPIKIDNIPEDKLRKKPDFVFLSNGEEETEIVVFELKGAELGKELLLPEYIQLRNYLDSIQASKGDITIKGLLVGHKKSSFQKGSRLLTDKRIEVVTWNEVLTRAKQGYLKFLEALLVFSNRIKPEDERVDIVRNFGDDDVKHLLDKILSFNKEIPDSSPSSLKGNQNASQNLI